MDLTSSAEIVAEGPICCRLLDGLEVRQAVIHDLAHVLVGNVFEFEPPTTAMDLRAAAAILQRCHPILRCAMRREGSELWFDSAGGAEVEVQEYECDIGTAADVELHLPLTDSCGWRLGVCGAYVLLTYHHAFLDGTSVMVILREVVSLLGNGCVQRNNEQNGTHLPPSARRCLLNRLPCEDSSKEPQVAVEALFVPVVARLAPPSGRRTCQLWRQVGIPITESLRIQCRNEFTTITGALGAAAVRSFARVFACPKQPLGVRTFFNIRSDCQVLPCSLGAYYSHFLCGLPVDEEFWETARIYRSKINAAIESKRHLAAAEELPATLDKQQQMFASQLSADNGSPGTSAIGISNRGHWELPSEEAHQVKACYAVQAIARVPKASFLMVNACSVNGLLCLAIVYVAPSCTDEAACAFADGLVEELISLVSS